MKEKIKSLLGLLGLVVILAVISCKGSSDDGPVTPPPPDEDDTEMVPDIYLMVFNASHEAGAIDVTVESTLLQQELAPTKNTSYHHFDQGIVEITIRATITNAILLQKTLDLEGGHLYSSYFYIDKENNYDLVLSQDFDDTRRLTPGSSKSMKFTAIHLSKNIPFDSIDIYNRESDRAIPLQSGLLIADRDWISNLAYGSVKKNEAARFGNFSNHVILASGNSELGNIPEGHEIELENVPAFPKITTLGPGNSGARVTLLNTRPFTSNYSYALITFNHATNPGEPDGKLIVLNSIPIVD